MSKNARTLATALAALLVVIFGGCNSTSLDDGDSADVVLEIQQISPTPITASPDPSNPAVCTFTVTDWTANLLNKAKNADAITSPYNDIVLQTLTLSYEWDSPAAGATAPRTVAVGGTIPAGGSGSVRFTPIALGDLDTNKEGHSASVSMLFRGETVSGNDVETLTGAQLVVNSCLQPPITGACCSGSTCSVVSASQCAAAAGTYLGDGTTCALNPCGGP